MPVTSMADTPAASALKTASANARRSLHLVAATTVTKLKVSLLLCHLHEKLALNTPILATLMRPPLREGDCDSYLE